METLPAFSLVVCTRNRGQKLDSFLEKIRDLSSEIIWELVLVNNGSTDDTGERLREFAKSIRGNVVVVNAEEPGLARARNFGWRQAKAPIIGFTDDDCYPQPDFVDCVLAAFEDNRVGFVGGRVLLYDPNDAHITVKESEKKEILMPPAFVPTNWAHGANMAFRREVLQAIGGFDELFGAGAIFRSGEDTDAQTRVLVAGWCAVYDPRIVVYHHHGRKLAADVLRLLEGYDIGRGAYFAKCLTNPDLRYRCLEAWLRRMITRRPATTRREISAAIKYFRMTYWKRR